LSADKISASPNGTGPSDDPPGPGPDESGGTDGDSELAIDVRDDIRAFRTRVWIFGQLLLGGLLDLVFIGLWILMQRFGDFCFDHFDSMKGMTHVKRQIMELMFDGATLSLVAAYILRDLYLSIRRIWRFR
jgi:hypothetical protein